MLIIVIFTFLKYCSVRCLFSSYNTLWIWLTFYHCNFYIISDRPDQVLSMSYNSVYCHDVDFALVFTFIISLFPVETYILMQVDVLIMNICSALYSRSGVFFFLIGILFPGHKWYKSPAKSP